MQPHNKVDQYLWYAFYALLIIGLFGALDIMDLRGEEPRRALVAWEMIYSGNYWQPSIQAWPYYNKPPVFNWVVAFFFKIFGTADWVVRLPSLLAFLGMGWVHYQFTKYQVDEPTARWSTAFLFSAAHFLFFATVLAGELDLFYAAIVYVQVICIYFYFHWAQWFRLFLLSYLLLSLGFLTKGLPSIAYQGLTFLALAFYYKKWRWLFSWQHIVGGIMGILPIAGYFYSYHLQYGNGPLYLFNLLEEASQKSAAEGRFLDILKQLLDFPLQFLVDHLPWSLLLLLFYKKDNRRWIKSNPFLVFCLLFFLSNIWLYWISPGSRNRYLYVFAPFFLTPLAYLYLKKPFLKPRYLLLTIVLLVSLRIVYNYTVMAYQQKTMGNIQLYSQISTDALQAAEGRPLATCCRADTILVNPSIGSVALLQDTIFIPMYMPYQIPYRIQQAREEILPFHQRLQSGYYYLSTDTLVGNPLKSYEVWDKKMLYLFKKD